MEFFYKIRHKDTGLYYKPGQTGYRKSSSLSKLGKTYDSSGKTKNAVRGLTHYNDLDGNTYADFDFEEHFEVVQFKVSDPIVVDIFDRAVKKTEQYHKRKSQILEE